MPKLQKLKISRLVSSPRKRAAILAVAIFAYSANALAGSKPVAPDVATPQRWVAVDKAVSSESIENMSQWWKRLGDATLSSLIERSLKSSPAWRTAQAKVRESRARRQLTVANRWPSLASTGSAQNSNNGLPASSTSGATSSFLSPSSSASAGSYYYGNQLSWDPDLSSAKRKATRAADAAYQATQSDLRNTQVSLAAEVALDYLQLRSYEVRLGIARRNEASQSETLQLVEWRNQAGLASSVEVEQARANRDQTRAQIPALESSLGQAQHTLELLVGVEPGSLTAELARSSTIPSPPDELAIGIPADALRQRPDVRAAEQRVAEQNALVAQQRAARYSTVSLSASLGWQALSGVLTGGASTLRSLTSGFTQTVYDGGRIRQNVAIQNALQDQAVVNYESAVLKALKEVENAILAFAKSGERLAALSTATEAARNAAQLAQNRYAAGLVDFQTVLDTERTALNLEDSVATTQADRTTAVVQLYQAMGGGWSEQLAGSATGKGTQHEQR